MLKSSPKPNINVDMMILMILNFRPNKLINPSIHIQLINMGINEIRLNSILPNEMVRNAKTSNPQKNSTKLKSAESSFTNFLDM